MKLRLVAPMLLALSACDSLLGPDPTPTDGGVARCADLPSVESGGPDGGVVYVAVDALDFPKSGEICLEPGQRYTIRVDPHSVAAFNVEAKSGSVDVAVHRGAARLASALSGWATAGKSPVTLVVTVATNQRAVFTYGLTLLALGPSRIGPVALPDGGTGSVAFEPTVDPALAPLIVPTTPNAFDEISIGLDRAVEEVLVDANCEPTPQFPERFFAVDLDAGSYRLADLGASSQSYRVRALRADGGVVVAGTLATLATVDFTLARGERLAIGAGLPVSRQTCGFDGGLPSGLVGPARFYLR